MRGADALAELSGALCSFWAAVYEATERAISLASLWRAAGEARSWRTPSHGAAAGARGRCGVRAGWANASASITSGVRA